MNDSPRHVALVLAAGGSRRLGQPKQLLKRDGETLLHRACRLALETSPQRVLLVTGAGEADMLAAVADLPVEAIHNASWERGLASSLAVAAKHLPDDHTPLLILGCDQPALSVDHLLQLMAASAQAKVAMHDELCCAATGYIEAVGMPAVVPAAMLRRAVTVGDIGLRKALNRLPPEQCPVVRAPELALDIDTIDNLQRARAYGLIDRD
ncbi:MAG: nucleotidyltransferase family protein [Xanthomonadales bacterium]|nr:nucleotidyltransferase family protein [Xanthomonadales bacterium]